MQHYPKLPSHETHAEPLALGNHSQIEDATDGLMSDVIFKLRVNQLVTTLRAQGIEGEASTMLQVLENLVIAGEITFPGFMLRVQNLFPDVFDKIDASLRDNLMRMLND